MKMEILLEKEAESRNAVSCASGKACGGKVIVQSLAKAGTLNQLQKVRAYVDYIVVAENQKISCRQGTKFNRSFYGEVKVPVNK